MKREVLVGVYQHFKGNDRLYRVVGVARGFFVKGGDLDNYKVLVHARDCNDPSEEFDVLEQICDTSDSIKGTLWLNGGKMGREYVIYSQEYASDFSVGTFWFRPKSNFLGYKVVGGKRVRRFTFLHP